jgi:import inner membrane translocase subunit TIM23
MSFLGGLFGGSAAPATPEKREHTTASDLFSSAQFDPSASANDLNAAGPSTPNLTQAPPIALPSALDTLNNAYSAQRLHPLAKLGDNLDFLALEEDKLTEIEGAASVLPSRGWTDDLCVGTGTTYLSGEQEVLRYV